MGKLYCTVVSEYVALSKKMADTIESLERNLDKLGDKLKSRYRKLVIHQIDQVKSRDSDINNFDIKKNNIQDKAMPEKTPSNILTTKGSFYRDITSVDSQQSKVSNIMRRYGLGEEELVQEEPTSEQTTPKQQLNTTRKSMFTNVSHTQNNKRSTEEYRDFQNGQESDSQYHVMNSKDSYTDNTSSDRSGSSKYDNTLSRSLQPGSNSRCETNRIVKANDYMDMEAINDDTKIHSQETRRHVWNENVSSSISDGSIGSQGSLSMHKFANITPNNNNQVERSVSSPVREKIKNMVDNLRTCPEPMSPGYEKNTDVKSLYTTAWSNGDQFELASDPLNTKHDIQAPVVVSRTPYTENRNNGIFQQPDQANLIDSTAVVERLQELYPNASNLVPLRIYDSQRRNKVTVRQPNQANMTEAKAIAESFQELCPTTSTAGPSIMFESQTNDNLPVPSSTVLYESNLSQSSNTRKDIVSDMSSRQQDIDNNIRELPSVNNPWAKVRYVVDTGGKELDDLRSLDNVDYTCIPSVRNKSYKAVTDATSYLSDMHQSRLHMPMETFNNTGRRNSERDIENSRPVYETPNSSQRSDMHPSRPHLPTETFDDTGRRNSERDIERSRPVYQNPNSFQNSDMHQSRLHMPTETLDDIGRRNSEHDNQISLSVHKNPTSFEPTTDTSQTPVELEEVSLRKKYYNRNIAYPPVLTQRDVSEPVTYAPIAPPITGRYSDIYNSPASLISLPRASTIETRAPRQNYQTGYFGGAGSSGIHTSNTQPNIAHEMRPVSSYIPQEIGRDGSNTGMILVPMTMAPQMTAFSGIPHAVYHTGSSFIELPQTHQSIKQLNDSSLKSMAALPRVPEEFKYSAVLPTSVSENFPSIHMSDNPSTRSLEQSYRDEAIGNMFVPDTIDHTVEAEEQSKETENTTLVKAAVSHRESSTSKQRARTGLDYLEDHAVTIDCNTQIRSPSAKQLENCAVTTTIRINGTETSMNSDQDTFGIKKHVEDIGDAQQSAPNIDNAESVTKTKVCHGPGTRTTVNRAASPVVEMTYSHQQSNRTSPSMEVSFGQVSPLNLSIKPIDIPSESKYPALSVNNAITGDIEIEMKTQQTLTTESSNTDDGVAAELYTNGGELDTYVSSELTKHMDVMRTLVAEVKDAVSELSVKESDPEKWAGKC